MAPQATLIVHGYSDCSKSFVKLKERLKENQVGTVDTILYGDYDSREDNITFNDVIDGLNDQLKQKGLIDSDGRKKTDLNVIVHSTGGLVIRHWIWRYYHDNIAECPVKRLIMLAPANFGSPLAHRGKSFLGRLVKGRWKIGDFLEVGRRLLNGLELASPYQWKMAHRDLFTTDGSYFNREQIQLTILVGIKDYSGIRGWVNKPGTDGTVVIAGTSLDAIKLGLDFSDPNTPVQWKETKTAHDFSFGVLPGLDHGSIVGNFSEKESQITKLTMEALQIEDAEAFKTYQQKLEEITADTYDSYSEKGTNNEYSKFQQFIIHAIDDQGAPVKDFTIEFYIYKADKAENEVIDKGKYFNKTEEKLSEEFQDEMLCEIHANKEDSSYRRLLVNLKNISKLMKKAEEQLGPFAISMKIFVPSIDRGIDYDLRLLQNVVIYRSDATQTDKPSLFFENTTTLIELEVNRRTSYVTLSTHPKD
ncbi:esterase/lipase family protein [Fodinibius sediminis]|uniref:Alpha/beta hydrolase n=1 Tax=Fodinibius sediminis TaxID=1214077 RepID=A0A521BEM6_9BACT|nr:alpha/beta hydrolase [Fodinibius sediminis]SMO45180.1 hypothetical protein SAMN06265218_10318 [Fodinibius sediminis]